MTGRKMSDAAVVPPYVSVAVLVAAQPALMAVTDARLSEPEYNRLLGTEL
jgi:hypothetical protein